MRYRPLRLGARCKDGRQDGRIRNAGCKTLKACNRNLLNGHTMCKTEGHRQRNMQLPKSNRTAIQGLRPSAT
eukprot:1810666-Alexandrium_andersonii.AAC.1